jgi:hypothetical protein
MLLHDVDSTKGATSQKDAFHHITIVLSCAETPKSLNPCNGHLLHVLVKFKAQSRQSAKLFLQSSELGLPQPLTRSRLCPPPPRFWGRGTLAGERGVGRVPIQTRGHTLWYSLHIRTLWFKVILNLYIHGRNLLKVTSGVALERTSLASTS